VRDHGGNLAEIYRIERGVTTASNPGQSSLAIGTLLAHALDISSDRVSADTIADLERILSGVRAQVC